MKITVKKGLDIPILGHPEGSLRPLPPPSQIALNLDPFEDIRFRVIVKTGEAVKVGQPLVESKTVPGQMFVSPAGGVVAQIRRGIKRRLLDVIINVDEQEHHEEKAPINLDSSSRDELIDFFMRNGLFPHIRLRPFNLVPDPKHTPRAIFVTAIETKPFAPPLEKQIEGEEKYFQAGLQALSKLTTGKVHLAYPEKSTYLPFTSARYAEKHTVEGPHPAGNTSVHIHAIDPIRSPEDYVWSLSALDVVIVGKMVLEGRYHIRRIITVAGPAIREEQRGYYVGRQGYPIQDLAEKRILNHEPVRLISGDPLTGHGTDLDSFLGFYHTTLSAFPINTSREPFHFFKLGIHKYSATRTYLSGHLPPPPTGYRFTTNQHGEERAFIDPAVYEKVMPMRIPTMHLIKAILAEDFEQADRLGLLEVVPEDFALTTFICPSKIEMMEIVKQGLHRYAKEMGH